MSLQSKFKKLWLSIIAVVFFSASAFAAAPTGVSAILNGAVSSTEANITVTTTDAFKFVDSNSSTASGTDLANISYLGVNPIVAVVDGNTTLTLTFSLEDISTAKDGATPLTIAAGTLYDGTVSNADISIADGSITDSAKPLVIMSGFADEDILAIVFSESVDPSSIQTTDFANITKDGTNAIVLDGNYSSDGFTNGVMVTSTSAIANDTVVLKLSAGLGDSSLNTGDIDINGTISDVDGNVLDSITDQPLEDMQEVRTYPVQINSATDGVLVDSDTIELSFSEPLDNNSSANIQTAVNTLFVGATDINATVSTTDQTIFTITFYNGTNDDVNISITTEQVLMLSAGHIVDLNDNANEYDMNISIQENTVVTMSPPMIAEFDVDNDAKYSSGDTIYMQFASDINISEFLISEINATDGNDSFNLGTGASLDALALDANISNMPSFSATTNDGTYANTFVLTLGTATDVDTGDHIVIDSTNITALSTNIEFPLLAVADVGSLADEVAYISTKLSEATDMPADMRTTIETLLAEAEALLGAATLDEAALVAKLAEIYAIVDTIGDEDAYLYGTDASKLVGTVTLPSGVTLTPEADCFDSYFMPLPTCNAVFIDLMAQNGEWLGSTMVDSNDSSYTLYFRALETSEELNATLQIHMQVDGQFEDYYYDFGADNAVNGGDDSFKTHMEVNWIEDTSTGMWNPDINNLTITAQETTLSIDISNMDANNYVVEGVVVVPSDFTPGEILGTSGEWLGFQMVNLTAIDNANGNHYWTEISRTASATNTYPFKFKLPNSEGNYTIRIEKFSDIQGATEWVEMYLDDGDDDRAFDGDESLVSANGIMWEETAQGSGLWLPDTTKTGFFTVSDNVDYSATPIDISTYGNNFYKIAGSVAPPNGTFDMSDYHNHMNVDILDAKTGWWIGGSPVMCDTAGANCTYSVVLGDSLNDYDGSGNGGYIVRVNQDHWDETNWENSWWKGFFHDLGTDNSVGGTSTDADSIINEMDVRWNESTELDSNGYPYWKPDVNHLHIDSATAAADVSDVNISFGDYTAPTTYTISGTITGIDANAQWANVHLYDPVNYVGNGAELKSDGTFVIQNVKAGKYVLELHYDVEDSGNYKHYHYIIADDDGVFTSGTSAVDGMEVKWVPYASDGTSLESSTYDPSFDWSTVSYWAPEETSSQKVMLNVSADISVASVAITQASLYNLTTKVTGLENSLNVDFNLFVPGEPIGRWENTTSANTEANATLKDLKERSDYQLQVWIEGLGEFWYDANTSALVSDVYWVGTQNGSVCDDWKTETWTCDYSDYSNPVSWGPNIDGFTVDATLAGTGLTLALPNDRAKVTATLAFGADDANKTVHVNMWQNVDPWGYAWEEYTADSSGNVAVSMSVKKGSSYRMEAYIPDNWEGYVVDLGSGTQTDGDESLITNQNSWATGGAWGPKSSTLIDLEDANLTAGELALGTLTPPSLNTLTFTIENLDGNVSGNAPTEQIFIDLEALDASNDSIYEWYGMDNADWSDWQNPTFSNTITVKVPTNANGYRVMIHPQNHKGGIINNGDGNANDVIAADATVSSFSWDWSKADKITVASSQAYTITLPLAADMKYISGTVSGISGSDMSGWVHAWSPTADGNGAEVNASGSFTINGLTAADDYTVEYWSWTQNEMIKVGDVNVTNSITDLAVTKSAIVHTLAGQVDTGDGSTAVANAVALLIDIDSGDGTIDTSDDWEVIDDRDVNDTISYEFNVSAPLTNHYYLVAVGVKDRNTTTGATTFTVYNPTQDSNITTDANTGDDSNATDINAVVTGIGSNGSVSVKLDHSKNQ